jgi:hypothetical protein
MKLLLLGILALLIVGYTGYIMVSSGQNGQAPKLNPFGAQKIESIEGQAIQRAKKVYEEKKKAKEDFEKSPCLSEDVGDGWAVDIVHNPRVVEDDQNKCNSYEQKTVTHIIEMTPDGKIVRAD